MISTHKSKEYSLGRRLKNRFKSKKDRPESVDASATDSEPSQASKGSNSDSFSVFIEPDSETLRSQSILKRTEIEHMSFKIGRRGSIGENYCGNKPDFLIAELEPFTVSRHHCSIKKTKNGAMIKDLGSKTGFMIMNERFGGRRGQKDRVEVGPGEHILILGPRGGHARFKLTIT